MKTDKTVNNKLLIAYWNVSRIIVENEQFGLDKAEYGNQLLKKCLKNYQGIRERLSHSNLQNMRLLNLSYSKC